jgi:dTMP kinase
LPLKNQSCGYFIVLEGIDGSGTTTQTERLVAHLRAQGRQAVATQEPSRGPVGRLLRELLHGQHATPDGAQVAGTTMALLFAADRCDHLQREIEPLLAAHSDVVSDRYLLSWLAYQPEESNREWVASLARGVRSPHLTVFVDVPVPVAAERRRAATRPAERYDQDESLARVATNYRRLAKEHPDVVTVDGDRPVEDVALSIRDAVDTMMKKKPW